MIHLLLIALTSIGLFNITSPSHAADTVLDIQHVTTQNGIEAWLVEDHSLPLISLKFSFKGAGAVNDGIGKQGLTRLLSNTMDEGAGHLLSQEFQKQLSDHSITLYFNAGRDHFGGQIKTLTRNKSKAFDLLKLALTQPRFDDEPVERMRQANLSRIKSSLTDPNWIAARIFNDRAFAGHPYSLNSGGTLSSLHKITAEDLQNHINKFLTQDRLKIGVSGDITKDELSSVLDEVFGSLPKTGVRTSVSPLTVQNTANTYLYEKDIPQTILSIAFPSISIDDPDYIALGVMNHIFGTSGFGSRLMEQAREKEGLTYGIYSGLVHQSHVDALTISTSTRNESVVRMREIIDEEIEKIIKRPISDHELKIAKSYLTGSLPLSLTSTDKISSILLSFQLNDRSIGYINEYTDKINTVTKEDVQRVANRLFKDIAPITIMVGDPVTDDNMIKVQELENVE